MNNLPNDFTDKKLKEFLVSVSRNGEIPFVLEGYTEGKTLDTLPRENNIHYKDLSELQKEMLAKDLAKFFNEIHSIPAEKINKLPQRDQNNDEKPEIEFIKRKRKLSRYGILLDEYKTNFKDDKVMCHNNLTGRNLIVDDSKENILMGINDFSMAGLNDRSSDFVKLCAIDRNLARNTVNEYNNISEHKVDMKEVDYKFLNWNAASLEMITNLPENLAKNFEKVTATYLNSFRNDVIKEKLEQKSQKPEIKTPVETQEIDPDVVGFYMAKTRKAKA